MVQIALWCNITEDIEHLFAKMYQYDVLLDYYYYMYNY